jgi:hypothetical protein
MKSYGSFRRSPAGAADGPGAEVFEPGRRPSQYGELGRSGSLLPVAVIPGCPLGAATWTLSLDVRISASGHRRSARRGTGRLMRTLSWRRAGRLKQLAAFEILDRKQNQGDARFWKYRLTPKGRALWPVIVSLLLWSNRWIVEDGAEEVVLENARIGDESGGFGALRGGWAQNVYRQHACCSRAFCVCHAANAHREGDQQAELRRMTKGGLPLAATSTGR